MHPIRRLMNITERAVYEDEMNIIMPEISLQKLNKTMVYVLINGEKAGVIHFGIHRRLVDIGKVRAFRLWSGEFILQGETIKIGPTEKLTELLPKVTRLVRSTLIRQNN
jgi:hypothetical protein